MFDQFLKKTSELLAQGESFVTATVVRCVAPTSGKPGDKAIIHGDGKIWGWIGGGCAQPVVVKEALKALVDGRPKLVRISPSESNPEEGTVDYTMTCHSGGALDIYLEPVLPKPQNPDSWPFAGRAVSSATRQHHWICGCCGFF